MVWQDQSSGYRVALKLSHFSEESSPYGSVNALCLEIFMEAAPSKIVNFI